MRRDVHELYWPRDDAANTESPSATAMVRRFRFREGAARTDLDGARVAGWGAVGYWVRDWGRVGVHCVGLSDRANVAMREQMRVAHFDMRADRYADQSPL